MPMMRLPPPAQWVPAAFVEDLERAGVSVESPWDLVKTKDPYPRAIPVLLDWLDRLDVEVPLYARESFREALVRSLAVKEARGTAAPALIAQFRRRDARHRWEVGNALSVVADEAVFDDVAELLRDASYGNDRQMLALAIGRMHDPRAEGVLLAALHDPRAWVRAEARRALEKFGRDG
jgi:hypothetical protein